MELKYERARERIRGKLIVSKRKWKREKVCVGEWVKMWRGSGVWKREKECVREFYIFNM